MAYNHGPKLVSSSLKLCYDAFNSRSHPQSNTDIWRDLSGNNSHATLGGLTLNGITPSRVANMTYQPDGVEFLGNAGFFVAPVTTDAMAGSTGARTYEAWFKCYTKRSQLIFGLLGYNAGIQLTSNNIATWMPFITPQSTSTNFYLSGATYNTNTWYHAVSTQTSTANRLYVNGVLSVEGTPVNFGYFRSGNPKIGGTGYVIGAAPSQQQYDAVTGTVSVCRFYSRELTAAEVLQNFLAFKGRYGL